MGDGGDLLAHSPSLPLELIPEKLRLEINGRMVAGLRVVYYPGIPFARVGRLSSRLPVTS